MTQPLSPLAEAADQLLRDQGTDLATWLAEQRAEGTGLREIANDLTTRLGWQHRPVSHQTVANWLAQLDREPAA